MQTKFLTLTDLNGRELADAMTDLEQAALIALAAIWSGYGLDRLRVTVWSQQEYSPHEAALKQGVTVLCPPEIEAGDLAQQINETDGWRAAGINGCPWLTICPVTPVSDTARP